MGHLADCTVLHLNSVRDEKHMVIKNLSFIVSPWRQCGPVWHAKGTKPSGACPRWEASGQRKFKV